MRFLASVFVALVTLPETTTIDIQMHTEALMNSCLGSGDGNVSKVAFRAASLKLFPNLRPSEYETVWSRIGKNGEGCLQFPGLQCVPSSCCPAGAHRLTPRLRAAGTPPPPRSTPTGNFARHSRRKRCLPTSTAPSRSGTGAAAGEWPRGRCQ